MGRGEPADQDGEQSECCKIFATGATNSMTQMTLEFSYDYQGRRIRKVVKQGATVVADQRFVYDGWNLIAVLDSSLNPVASFTWGMDVSGSLQGAGGVGGLVISRFYGGPNSTTFPAYDGNGNIGTLFYDNGGIAAQYEYGPFGELIRATGPLAQSNPFRFSTKYTDDETDLVYYGYRYYSPSLGRWISKDPIEENGGQNLYGFTDNNPLNRVDTDGRGIFDLTPGGRNAPPPTAQPALPSFTPIDSPPFEWKGHKLTCDCDDSTIQKGETTLKQRFQTASEYAQSQGFKPVYSGKEGASCKNSSQAIIWSLAPYPKCWQCYLDLRRKYNSLPLRDKIADLLTFWTPPSQILDHQIVICAAYNKDGKKAKEIVFDWWGDNRHGKLYSGGPPDPLRSQYPFYPEVRQCPFYSDCEGNTHWTPIADPWEASRPGKH